VTNGLGGYASSTIIGTNARTYHGLLVAALNPPVDRTLLLSSLDEEIRLNGETHHLASHKYPGIIHPEGSTYLKHFSLDPFPTTVYQIGDLEVTRCVFMIHGENTTIIRYSLNNDADDTDNTILRVFPLVNMRDFHSTTSSSDIYLVQDAKRTGTKLRSDEMKFTVTSNMRYHPDEMWFYNFEYDKEHERGLAYREDNYNPGYFEIELKQGTNHIFVAASTSDLSDLTINDIEDLYNKEVERLHVLGDRSGFNDDLALKLTLAADSFIVRRASTHSRSIIAGYHWFSDWGRDAMISLPGLTLVTGRFEDSKQILLSFAQNCRDGLIPNRFADSDKYQPDYNTVDASLWFVHAVGRYFAYTGDTAFVETIWGTISDIISSYTEGTHFGIRMDDDGLITHGSQLTWMDAKIGTFEVTPRRGKTCEINALWYNALRTAAHLAEHLQKDPSTYELLAVSAKHSFTDTFWNQDDMCLFDCVGVNDDNTIIKDPAIRPNQIFSVSLPYTVLPRKKEISIVRRVEKDLLTPMGLRTLSCDNVAYKGRYEGDPVSRDMAYHNGTVWPWLMGPYVSAYTKIHDHSHTSRDHASSLLRRFDEQLQDSGIGTICEICDGDYPYIPRGCISQAWSVAEILRAYVEDVLYDDYKIEV